MKPFESSNFLVLGLARDCDSVIAKSISVIENAFQGCRQISFLVIESDSHDQTADSLQDLANEMSHFSYRCLGNLSRHLPLRTQRIAYCRNFAIQEMTRASLWSSIDYVALADLDGVNHGLTSQAVKSCWDRSDWDVCTANQSGPYYDIWALRHKIWCPTDAWEQVRFFMKHGLGFTHAVRAAVYAKMISIKPHAPWIEVDSAFGGFAIYKSRFLRDVEYIGVADNGDGICEHLSVHAQIRSRGGRIFINPRMVNASVVEHAKYVSEPAQFRLYLRARIRGLLEKVRGLLPRSFG